MLLASNESLSLEVIEQFRPYHVGLPAHSIALLL